MIDRIRRVRDTTDPFIAELRGIRVALEQLLQFTAAKHNDELEPLNESECIAWFIQHMQEATELPSLATVAREARINTRQLRHDRWPRFRKVYDQLAGLVRGIDKARMAAAIDDLEDE